MSHDDERLLELEKRCLDAGVPMTLQRRAVLEVLLSRQDHPTADEIFADVSSQLLNGVSRATVFRTLDLLVERGLLIRVCHPGAAARYDVKTRRHHHLVCDLCGRITDFDDAELDELALPDFDPAGFQVRDYSVHVRGLCHACSSKATDEAQERKD
ncbi:MAG: transcriptional repressor [Planctomycetota bacterium]